jgi:hypothetical protein
LTGLWEEAARRSSITVASRTSPRASCDRRRKCAALHRTSRWAASGRGIDALIALQGVEDPLERRKRAVKRGRIALDELKIGLLGGAFSAATFSNLRSAAVQLKLSSGNPDLDAVLAEIELRVEVEIAKMAQRERKAAGQQ